MRERESDAVHLEHGGRLDSIHKERRRKALLKTTALQDAILNSANFLSIATDEKGVIQLFNAGAERMLGYVAAEVIDRITPAAITDQQELIARAEALSIELATPVRPGFEALVYKASRGIEDIYGVTYIGKNGARLGTMVSVMSLRNAENVIIGYLLIGTDNTARQRAEVERARLDQVVRDKSADLELAKSVAEKANLAKSEFLARMSHELRTPLSAILGFAQLMDSGSPPPTSAQKRSLNQILQAGWHLLDLVNDILDLAQIESGKISMLLQPIALSEVVRECQAMMAPEAKKRDIRMTFSHFDVPYFVAAEHTRLKQVFINLLSNAIKYNKLGGVVEVDCFVRTPERVRISVRDTGEGLTREKLAQLFQPFNRLGERAGAEEGTGIGLVVSKRLVELMNGAIGVQSTVGVGSVFWVELDLLTQTGLAAGAAAPKATAPARVFHAGTRPRTLLYVEDNPASLMLVKDLVARRPDIRLLTAGDANRGIEIARRSLPDVILMDINLPGISGIEAREILAGDLSTADIPVVALSADAMPRDIEKGLRAGFFRYLTKPIEINEFMNTLEVALKFAESKAERRVNEEQA